MEITKSSLALVGLIFLLREVVVLALMQQRWFKSAKNIDYYIEQEYQFTWFEAFVQCSQRNMSLVTLETFEKHNDIANILLKENFKFKAPHLWVGGIGENRKFAWISNSQPIMSSKWLKLNPDNWNNEEKCIHFWENTTDINDRRCDLKYGFICEQNPYFASAGNDVNKYRQIVLNFNNK